MARKGGSKQPKTEPRALRSSACTRSCDTESETMPTSDLDSLLVEEAEGGKLTKASEDDGEAPTPDTVEGGTLHSSSKVCSRHQTTTESEYIVELLLEL